MKQTSLVLLALWACGCIGEAEFQLPPGGAIEAPLPPTGEAPIQVGIFRDFRRAPHR